MVQKIDLNITKTTTINASSNNGYNQKPVPRNIRPCDPSAPRRFFFIGFMGVGKTTCSQKIADEFGLPHVELDTRIQEAAGKSVRRIFDEDGEPAYREMEHRVLIDAIDRFEAALISCGGGIVCHSPNRNVLRTKGYCILLEASPESIFERLRGALPPLLDVPNPMDRIVSLQRQRREHYLELADWTYDTTDKTIQEVCTAVYNHIHSLSIYYAGY